MRIDDRNVKDNKKLYIFKIQAQANKLPYFEDIAKPGRMVKLRIVFSQLPHKFPHIECSTVVHLSIDGVSDFPKFFYGCHNLEKLTIQMIEDHSADNGKSEDVEFDLSHFPKLTLLQIFKFCYEEGVHSYIHHLDQLYQLRELIVALPRIQGLRKFQQDIKYLIDIHQLKNFGYRIYGDGEPVGMEGMVTWDNLGAGEPSVYISGNPNSPYLQGWEFLDENSE